MAHCHHADDGSVCIWPPHYSRHHLQVYNGVCAVMKFCSDAMCHSETVKRDAISSNAHDSICRCCHSREAGLSG